MVRSSADGRRRFTHRAYRAAQARRAGLVLPPDKSTSATDWGDLMRTLRILGVLAGLTITTALMGALAVAVLEDEDPANSEIDE